MAIGTSRGISILMPVYMKHPSERDLGLLDRALASISEQSYPAEAEIVIVDDGSPQPISDLIRPDRYGSALSMRILRSYPNNGIVHALNVGLHAAKYSLIARMDADDRWRAGKIEQQVKRLEADDLTIVGTGMTRVFEDGSPSDVHIRPDGWTPALRFFVESGCPFPHGSILARKDIYQLLGGYPHAANVAHCEDYALWSVWLRFFRPGMIEAPLYDYTVSSGSVSMRHSQRQQEATGRINTAFARLKLTDELPGAMRGLADALGVSLVQAGVVAYRLWLHRPLALLPESAAGPLSRVLVDRRVRHKEGGGGRPVTLASLLRGFEPTSPSDEAVVLTSIL